ncbi:Predicted metal-dependent peptidase [Clostridium cavendishii DSM 21758]|uniref:Predicted metal-dependent peptidase n=1 Tax=Clostridium cavendishii DSM 21758 TaxID=1121302 RepID=A0A1M6Q3C1_9CLOT|nr:VWA-like domain-containing protein [Clostridium cavendishii]SHK14607.1 Predicted metal-dependent peptidase [Clostridium cavendishii DSM 21758]
MNFHGKRIKLLKEALSLETTKQVTKQFEREFLEILEYIVMSMIDKEENFFGQFMIQVKREIAFNITWPIATVIDGNGFKMYFNPILFLNCEIKEMQALIKHEIYHIMLSHYEREKKLKDKYSKLAVSTALDIAVNQYVKNLPLWCTNIDRVNLEFDLELKEDMTIEIYTELIQNVINKKLNNKFTIKAQSSEFVKEICQEDAHELWGDENISLDNFNTIRKKTAINAYKGKAPKNIENIIIKLKEKPEIEWNECIRRLLPSIKSGYRKTITRKDRRMPDRLELRGVLPNSIPQILIAIDISASMTDEEVEKIMVEIIGITKGRKAKLKVIECDDEIRRVYDLNTIKDIKKRVKKNGSTRFSPVFEYIKANRLRNHILIYFTDGVGEKELTVKPINYKTLWVVTGKENLSLNRTYGQVTHIHKEVTQNYGYTYGLQALRDEIHDWAR